MPTSIAARGARHTVTFLAIILIACQPCSVASNHGVAKPPPLFFCWGRSAPPNTLRNSTSPPVSNNCKKGECPRCQHWLDLIQQLQEVNTATDDGIRVMARTHENLRHTVVQGYKAMLQPGHIQAARQGSSLPRTYGFFRHLRGRSRRWVALCNYSS